MNKELEETIKRLKQDYELAKSEDSIDIDVFTSDLETILNYIENSISKEVIEKKIEDNAFEVHTREWGNVEVISIEVLQEILEEGK